MTSQRHVMKVLLTALVIAIGLLVQGNAAQACDPPSATIAAQHPVRTPEAPQPLVPCDHDGIACCMNGVCQTVAASPAVMAEAPLGLALVPTRYHAVPASLHSGLTTAPALPPPRLRI